MELVFEYQFKDTDTQVYFAFSYPFSYTECQLMCNDLETEYEEDPDIYFYREFLVKSAQGRMINLLTISSHEGKLN